MTRCRRRCISRPVARLGIQRGEDVGLARRSMTEGPQGCGGRGATATMAIIDESLRSMVMPKPRLPEGQAHGQQFATGDVEGSLTVATWTAGFVRS